MTAHNSATKLAGLEAALIRAMNEMSTYEMARLAEVLITSRRKVSPETGSRMANPAHDQGLWLINILVTAVRIKLQSTPKQAQEPARPRKARKPKETAAPQVP